MLVRRLTLLAVALAAFAGPAALAAAETMPHGGLIPGVVEPPLLGLTLHDDVIQGTDGQARASAKPVAGTVEEPLTPSGYHVKVETSAGYVANPAFSQELVNFLDSLLHGPELDGLTVFVALPEEMSTICEGPAAACYYPPLGTIYIVGLASYGGFPTSYVLAHEYGHRIEDFRHNPPFGGGALSWGTKRWASQERVCPGTLQGKYVPGGGGEAYPYNPSEAMAEAYAWYHFGSGLVEWEYVSSLRPNAASYDAIREDVLEPWQPVVSERQGYLSARRIRKVYALRPRNDGWVQVRMTGGGDLDIGLFDTRNRLLASSVKARTSRERLNYVVCGQRKLKLVVEAYRPPGRYRLEISQP